MNIKSNLTGIRILVGLILFFAPKLIYVFSICLFRIDLKYELGINDV